LPRSSGIAAALLLAAACAQEPVQQEGKPAADALPALPATYVSDADCPGCLAVTLTLRPDGSYLVRDQLGSSEFYDFGRWRYAEGALELAGGRDTRRYPLRELRRAARVEALRGPFRMVGHYDGARFTECRSGVSWAMQESRAAEALREEWKHRQGGVILVALDGQFEGAPETLRIFRPATLLNTRTCPR
jgi:hypothetical protein